jgi:hypothetical protein
MTTLEKDLPALRGTEELTAHVRLTADEESLVDVAVAGLTVQGRGPDFFDALADARRQLADHALVLRCNGSRRDVYPSAMLRQSARGLMAYVLTVPRRSVRPEVVDIFDPADDVRLLASVDEQRAWFDAWRRSPLDGAGPASAGVQGEPGTWLYEIVGDYGPDDAVPPTAIRGAWPVDESGRPVGAFIPNPNFSGGEL